MCKTKMDIYSQYILHQMQKMIYVDDITDY